MDCARRLAGIPPLPCVQLCLAAGDKPVRKIAFCRRAVEGPDRFKQTVVLDDDLKEAIDWIAARTPQQAPNAVVVRLPSGGAVLLVAAG